MLVKEWQTPVEICKGLLALLTFAPIIIKLLCGLKYVDYEAHNTQDCRANISRKTSSVCVCKCARFN